MKKILETLKRKWAEYLLEIIVIIIGILGAYTLNNWNEEKKDRELERNYLSDINAEFKENKIQFERGMASHKKGFNNCLLLISVFPITPHKWDSIYAKYPDFSLVQGFSFNPSQSTIEAMINSSSFDLIQNPRLKRLLISWKDLALDFKDDENNSYRFLVDRFSPFMQKNMRIQTRELLEMPESARIEFENLILIRSVLFGNIVNNQEKEAERVQQAIESIITLTEPYSKD